MTVPSSLSALSLHPIFKPAVNPLSSPGQLLASSSAVPLFAVYDHLPPACTISDQAYANMPRFSTNDPRAVVHFCNPIVNGRWVPEYPQNPGNQGNANVMNS
ncbi:hypothetical protein BDFG_05207 [Blastomyces dermatitidis ATCC 26199]|nr:hypothetical protein BDFG_05207 [Blastomyces dermatitidis ATCC 26199]